MKRIIDYDWSISYGLSLCACVLVRTTWKRFIWTRCDWS